MENILKLMFRQVRGFENDRKTSENMNGSLLLVRDHRIRTRGTILFPKASPHDWRLKMASFRMAAALVAMGALVILLLYVAKRLGLKFSGP